MPSFSERHGYSQPKGITYRDELPVGLRIPIFQILLERSINSEYLWKRIKKLLNPYFPESSPRTGMCPQKPPENPVESQHQTPPIIGADRDRGRDRPPFES